MIVLIITGQFIRQRIGNIEFGDLSIADQGVLQQVERIYKEADLSQQSKMEKVTLLVSHIGKEGDKSSKYCYLIGDSEMLYFFFGERVNMPVEMNIPSVYRVRSLFKSVLWNWFTAQFVFVDIGYNYTFFYRI